MLGRVWGGGAEGAGSHTEHPRVLGGAPMGAQHHGEHLWVLELYERPKGAGCWMEDTRVLGATWRRPKGAGFWMEHPWVLGAVENTQRYWVVYPAPMDAAYHVED